MIFPMHILYITWLIAIFIGSSFIANANTENIHEQQQQQQQQQKQHFRNCPVSTLKNKFTTRCESKYPLEHFDENFINNRSTKMITILANSKLEKNGCLGRTFGAREFLTYPESDLVANLTCARFCPVTNDILKVFRNKR